MKSPIYTILEQPLPQPRPRFKRNGSVFDPAASYKRDLGYQFLKQRNFFYENEVILDENDSPISLYITFFMPIPKSYSQKKKSSLVDQPHTSKPDLDNLIKLYLDAAKNILIVDDSLIFQIHSKKVYSKIPRTEFFFLYGAQDGKEVNT